MNEIQSPTNIRDQIQFNSTHYGDRTWLISPETSNSVSFREVEETVLKIGQNLLDSGIKPGSSIAIASPNSTASCLMFMAIVSAGFVAVPLNLVAGASILAYTVEHAEVQLIFVAEECRELIHSAIKEKKNEIRMVLLDPITGPDLNAIPKVEKNYL